MAKTGSLTRRSCRFLTAALLIALAFAVRGQELNLGQAGMHENLRRWSYQDGLPSVSITAMAETADGYLWLATQEGLVRFNGREFFVFDTGNVPLLQHNDVRRLLTRRDGTLWLCNFRGEILSYRDRAFTAIADSQLLPSPQVNAWLEDASGRLWIGTSKGPAVIASGKVAVPLGLKPLVGQRIVALASDAQERLLLATPEAVFRWDEQTLQLLHQEQAVIRDICLDRKNRLWVATEQGLVVVAAGVRRAFTARDGLADDLVTRLFLDREDTLWVGTATGVVQVGSDLSMAEVFQNAAFTEDGLVNAFHQDRRGFMWMATRNSLLRLSHDLFITYDVQKGLRDDMVLAIFCDSAGRLWIGSDTGLSRLDPDGTMQAVPAPGRLGRNAVLAIAQDRRGRMWFGSERGLIRSHGSGGAFFTSRDGLPSDTIRALMIDRHDRLWVGTSAGYCLIADDRLRQPDPGTALEKEEITLLHEAASGDVWIGTRTRLFVLRAGVLEPVALPGGSGQPIFLSAFEEMPGTLWIGTYADGLYRVCGRRISHVGKAQGLPGNSVYGILKDPFGFLWMSNNGGVFKVRSSDLHAAADGARASVPATRYGKSDGMKAVECNGGNSPSLARLPDGRLAFATIGGLVIADPDRELTLKSPPPVVIEKILADNLELDPLRAARLPAGTRMLDLSFIGLDLQEPENVLYRYRIDGLDPDWHDLGGSGRLTLSNPGPGDYVVHIAASTNGSTWSERGAEFAFGVRPYWYQTRAFLLLAFLLTVGGAVAGHRLRVRFLRLRGERLEARVRQRTEELKRAKENVEQALQQEELARRQLAFKNEELEQANQLKTELMGVAAHDLRSPLQLIMGYSELIGLKAGNADYVRQKSQVIQQTSERMSQLIHDLLQTSSLEAGNIVLNKTRVDLNGTANLVAQAYAPFVQQKQQTLHLATRCECVVRGDAERLREIVENLVSNAVKYTPPGGAIRVITERVGARCRFIIADEGPGFTEDDRQKLFGKFQKLSARPTGGESSFGLGLAIVKMLVELHEGEIQLESEPGKGCRFIVELPGEPSLN